MSFDIAKLHFILPTGDLRQRSIELNNIRVWALTNPTKKIVVWYDSLADLSEIYFNAIYDNAAAGIQTPHGYVHKEENQSRIEQGLENVLNRSTYLYLMEFGGTKLAQGTIDSYLARFSELLGKNFIEYYGPPRFSESDGRAMYENVNNAFVQLQNELKDVQWDAKRVKDGVLKVLGINNPRDTKNEIMIRDILCQNFPQDLQRNFEVKDLFHELPNMAAEKLHPLYLFEILYNREMSLANNIFTYMIASNAKNELVVSPRVLPKLNFKSTDYNITEDRAVLFILKNMESEHKLISDDNVPNIKFLEDHTYDPLRAKYLEMKSKNINLFKPIENSNESSIYGSYSEQEGIVSYFMFPKSLDDNFIELNFTERLFQARFAQIKSFPITALESVARERVMSIMGEEFNSLYPRTLPARNDVLLQNDMANYMKMLCARFSRYQPHNSEITGSQFWINMGVEQLQSVNVNEIFPTNNAANREQALLTRIFDQRSTFDLEIFIYIHQPETDHLGRLRYASFSKNGIYFEYDQSKSSDSIMFNESGLIMKTDQGERPMQDGDVTHYLQENFLNNEKRIRIHVLGHSQADYTISESKFGFNVTNEKQTLGGLNVDVFNQLFTHWFDQYMGKLKVERIVFVACNLARFKEVDLYSYKANFVPKDSFLERFIDNFNRHGIHIKETVASNAYVVVPHSTGRMKRVREIGNTDVLYRGDPQEIRKIKIDSNPINESNMEHDQLIGKYQFKAIHFGFEQEIFNRDNISGRAILDVPPYFEKLSKHFVDTLNLKALEKQNFILAPDTVAMIQSMRKIEGKILIVDNVPQIMEGYNLAIKMATLLASHELWMTFLKVNFPQSYHQIAAMVNKENFEQLLINIFSERIILANIDLATIDAHNLIVNYLEIEADNVSIGYVYPPNPEVNLNERVSHMETIEHEQLVLERQAITDELKRLAGIEQRNIQNLARDGAPVISQFDSHVSTAGTSREIESGISTRSSIALMSRDTLNAKSFAETYHLAQDLHNAYQDILTSDANEVTAEYIPILDTLANVESSEPAWTLTFEHPNNIMHPSVTIETKASIFERVSTYIKNNKISSIHTSGTTVMNLIFGVQALCHWVEYGFTADVRGISNKSLATAIEVHFYVNAIGLMQGLLETGVLIGTSASQTATVIKALRPFMKLSAYFSKISTGGRMLLSMGESFSKALPIIGLVVNVADLGLNIFELAKNNDPYQRPAIITNIVFSAVGLAISTAAAVAGILGASAVAGPLGLVGLGIALIYIPVSFLVGKFTANIEGAKHTGLVLKAIREEIEAGTYKKDSNGNILHCPSYVAVNNLTLRSSMIEVGYGKIDYKPTSIQNNWFSYFYKAKDLYYVDPNHSKVLIDENYRTIVMPYLPGYTFNLIDKYAPFSANRHDAEFGTAIELQENDPGFQFQIGGAGFLDQIASEFRFDYENTDIKINITESNWKLIFPWGDTAHAKDDNEKEKIKASNNETAAHLEKINYYITSDSPGRQTICFPGLDCPVQMHLKSSEDVVWFLDSLNTSLSDKDVSLKENYIKIGSKQTIYFEKNANVYVRVPKFEHSVGHYVVAYLELINKLYIYCIEFNETEQQNAILLYTTNDHSHSYFYQLNEHNTEFSIGDTIWCVSIETKKIVARHDDVKSFQKQGNGMLIVTTHGVINYLNKDIKSQRMVPQVIGFLDDWFNQGKGSHESLDDIDSFLMGKSYNPTIHIYLPYYKHTGGTISGNILYYPDKNVYFILDGGYANTSDFLKCGAQNQIAYFHAKDKQQLISVKGLNKDETSTKLQLHDGKININAEESYQLLMHGIVDAVVTPKGIKIKVSSGVVFELCEDQSTNPRCVRVQIERIIIDQYIDNVSMITRPSEQFMNEILIKFEEEHFTDSIRETMKIDRSAFIAIEKNGKNVGFYETITKRILCLASLPPSRDITPLGSDEQFAYDILDNKQIYLSEWATSIPEIEKKYQYPSSLLFEADALELFDQTLFVKMSSNSTYFNGLLKILSKLQEIDLIWIESRNYYLRLTDFEAITFSSIDLSDESSKELSIHLFVENFERFHLVREGFDLCLYEPEKKVSYIFKEAFNVKTNISALNKIKLSAGKDVQRLSEIISAYDQYQNPVVGEGKLYYRELELSEIMKLNEEIKNKIRSVLWPNDDEKQKIFQDLTSLGSVSIARGYQFNCLASDPIIIENLLRNTKEEHILYAALKENKFEIFKTLLENIEKYSGKSLLRPLLLWRNKNRENIIHYAIRNCNQQTTEALMNEMDRPYLADMLKELVLNVSKGNKTLLSYAFGYRNCKAIQMLSNKLANFVRTEKSEEMWSMHRKTIASIAMYDETLDYNETSMEHAESIYQNFATRDCN